MGELDWDRPFDLARPVDFFLAADLDFLRVVFRFLVAIGLLIGEFVLVIKYSMPVLFGLRGRAVEWCWVVLIRGCNLFAMFLCFLMFPPIVIPRSGCKYSTDVLYYQ